MKDTVQLIIIWLIEYLELIAAALIVFASLVAVYKFFIKARLKIIFDPNETYHERTVENGRQAIFLHLIIKNRGFVTARNCEGYLIKVMRFDKERHRFVFDDRFPAQLILKWAHEKDFSSKPILPRNKRPLDLVFAHPGDQNLCLFTEHFPRGSNTFFTSGVYLVDIAVISDNAKEVKGTFELIWNADWKNIQVKKIGCFDKIKLFFRRE